MPKWWNIQVLLVKKESINQKTISVLTEWIGMIELSKWSSIVVSIDFVIEHSVFENWLWISFEVQFLRKVCIVQTNAVSSEGWN